MRVFAFALLGLALAAAAEMSQAVAEGFLVPQEEQMHGLVNQTRASGGMRPLPPNDALRAVARRQAQAMAVAGYIFHTKDLAGQATAASLPWLALGENVGVGPSVEAVQNAFLNSAHHLENIVDPRFNALGVGATPDSKGALFFAQDFGALRGPAAAPASASAAVSTTRPASPAGSVPPARVAVEAARPAGTPVPAIEALPDLGPDRTVLAQIGRSDATHAQAIFARNGAITPAVGSSGRPSLVGGLVAMLQHALAKLAFWD
jgi:hypothetical protein